MPDDPTTLNLPRPLVPKREAERMVLVSLTKKQALQLGPGLPTLQTFLPIAKGSQLNQLRSAIPFQWSRSEYGASRDEVTLLAIVNPTRRHLAENGISPAAAKHRVKLVAAAIDERARLVASIHHKLARIETEGSAAQKRQLDRKLDELIAGRLTGGTAQ